MRLGPTSLENANAGAMTALVALLLWLVLSSGCGREAEETTAPSNTDTPGASRELVMKSTSAPARPAVLTPAVMPAPKPTAPLPPGTSCVTAECHATFATAPQIHAPVAERACDACHDADVGGHRFPLKRGGGNVSDSCTFCHTVSGTMSHQHKALEQGCQTCHDPHAAGTKFLLKADSVEHLCRTCHDMPIKRFAHGPYADGQCTLCHQPHESAGAKLLRGGEGAQHCFTCHGDLQQTLASASGVHEPAADDCNACHGAHATDHPHLLAAPIDQTCLRCHEPVRQHLAAATVAHAAMSDEASCLNCHAPHRADHPMLLRQRMDQVCLTCHDQPLKSQSDGRTIASMKPALTQAKFLHGAIRAGDCSACHDAHGAGEHALLVAAFPESSYARFNVDHYALCFETCHSNEIVLTERITSLTNFRDGETNLHFVHVNRDEKGRSCKTCHSIHGSNLPNHMASEVPFERSGWSMPIGFEKTTSGGSCAPGCHAPRTYERAEGSPTTAPTRLPLNGPTTMPTTRSSLRGVP